MIEQKMPALSIRQPWAWAILHAGKDIENRSWRTAFRGEVLIHAGLRPECEMGEFIRLMDDAGVALPENTPLAVSFRPCRGRLGFFVPEASP